MKSLTVFGAAFLTCVVSTGCGEYCLTDWLPHHHGQGEGPGHPHDGDTDCDAGGLVDAGAPGAEDAGTADASPEADAADGAASCGVDQLVGAGISAPCIRKAASVSVGE